MRNAPQAPEPSAHLIAIRGYILDSMMEVSQKQQGVVCLTAKLGPVEGQRLSLSLGKEDYDWDVCLTDTGDAQLLFSATHARSSMPLTERRVPVEAVGKAFRGILAEIAASHTSLIHQRMGEVFNRELFAACATN